MRKATFLMTAALMACYITVNAQNEPQYKPSIDQLYLTVDEVPNAVFWLPAPPEPGSTQFTHDINQYYWGKQQRLDSARAEKAIREVAFETADMVKLYSPAFGMEISPEKTPAIFKVLHRALMTIRLSASRPKATYGRLRPYVRFNESTLYPAEEEELRETGSYPSGHTVRGWGMALLLCEINPAAQDEVFKLGYEWGQSRVIAGYHWQSDVDASRMLAAAAYARLHACEEFLADMADARKEFKKLKKD
jgi:acid phosphatase (class A)